MASAMKIMIALLAAAGFVGASVTYIIMGIANMRRGKKAAEKGKSELTKISCGKLWIGIVLLLLLLTAGILDITDSTSRLNWKILGVSWIAAAAAGLAMCIQCIYMRKHVRFTEDGIYKGLDFIGKNECSYKYMRVSDEKSVFSLFIGKRKALIVTPESNERFRDFLSLRYNKADGKAKPFSSQKWIVPVAVGVGLGLVLFAAYWITKPVIFVGSTVLRTNAEHAYFCWNWITDPAYCDDENRLGLECADGWEVQDTNKLTSSDMKMLKYMPNLKRLNIMNNSIDDLSFLNDLDDLEDLYFGADKNPKMPELSPIAGLTKLRRLVFKNVGVKEFDGFRYLSGLPDLTCLLTEDVIITQTEMAEISRMKNLVLLDLTGCRVDTLDGIQELDGLKELNLQDCTLGDISAVVQCKNLENLNLMNSGLTDLSFLGDMDSIKSLNISKTSPEDYSFLYEMDGLKELYIHESMHEDLEDILEELHVSVYSNE